MLNFAPYIDLPLVRGGLIATALCLYVLLDGFDLGVGILFPFAPTDDCRHKMINSIAPFWNGKETWLVLGGSVLFAAFPLAYSLLLPALYIAIILMLLGLIFRGVAFEFRLGSYRSPLNLGLRFPLRFYACCFLSRFNAWYVRPRNRDSRTRICRREL